MEKTQEQYLSGVRQLVSNHLGCERTWETVRELLFGPGLTFLVGGYNSRSGLASKDFLVYSPETGKWFVEVMTKSAFVLGK